MHHHLRLCDYLMKLQISPSFFLTIITNFTTSHSNHFYSIFALNFKLKSQTFLFAKLLSFFSFFSSRKEERKSLWPQLLHFLHRSKLIRMFATRLSAILQNQLRHAYSDISQETCCSSMGQKARVFFFAYKVDNKKIAMCTWRTARIYSRGFTCTRCAHDYCHDHIGSICP